MNIIPFHKSLLGAKELEYVNDCMTNSKLSGDGIYSKKCQAILKENYGFERVLLTPSCTDALELAALLLDLSPGDEVIVPSYTFVSSANPFILCGAKVVFADSEPNHPNVCPDSINALITNKTKAIVIVHYGGVACNMSAILDIVKRYNLILIEDAAQAIHAKADDKYLGQYGHMSAFSFHETKNLTCGEGGMLVINDETFFKRAEIIREKGTNRSAFMRGEINKYEWADKGSSFLLSDILAAVLFAQLEKADELTKRRLEIWNYYFKMLGNTKLTEHLTNTCIHNGSVFYVMCKTKDERIQLNDYLSQNGVMAATHYVPLHTSQFGKQFLLPKQVLSNAERFASCLLRLPLHNNILKEEVDFICKLILTFLKDNQ